MEMAAMLSQIGCVTLPGDTLDKIYRGTSLSPAEEKMYQLHPQMGCDLINNIPRLEKIAEIISYQEKRFDGTGLPEDAKVGSDIPTGARVLKLALDFDMLVSSGLSEKEAMAKIVLRGESWYDPDIVFALQKAVAFDGEYETVAVSLDELGPNMILADDVKGTSGIILIAKGQEVTPSLHMRLKNYAMMAGIREPIKVVVQLVANDRSNLTE